MTTVVLATKNAGKITEIKAVLDVPGVTWITYEEQPDWPEVVEDGPTFLANATLKAAALAAFFKLPALADDSGLEVEALDGRPGINSARFAGPGGTDDDNINKLLHEMRDAPEAARKAGFVAVVVLAWPDGRTISATGTCSGSIGTVPRGERGFGYDPVFIPDGHDRTMAELTAEEKNSLSHRGKALRQLRHELDVILSPQGEGDQGEGPKGVER